MKDESIRFKFQPWAESSLVILLAVLFTMIVAVHQTGARAAESNSDDRSTGRILKSEQKPAVYFVSKAGFKLGFPNAKVFLSYGYKWADATSVPAEELNGYKQTEYIKQIGNAAVYKIENGQKRYLTQASAAALAIEPNSVIPVNKTEFKFYKSAATISEAEAKQIVESKKQTALQPGENFDPKKCTADARVGGVDGCIIYQALLENNVQLCEQAHEENWKAKCYGSFLLLSGDPLVNCSKLTNSAAKDICIQSIAFGKKDSSLCQKINSQDTRLQCGASIGVANKDITVCESLPDNQSQISKDACKFTFALLNNQQNVCDKISAASAYKTLCLNNFSKSQAQ